MRSRLPIGQGLVVTALLLAATPAPAQTAPKAALVRDITEASATLYRESCLELLYGASLGGCNFKAVPDGHRLMVEVITARLGVNATSSGSPGIVSFGRKASFDCWCVDPAFAFSLAWSYTGPASGQYSYSIHQPTKLYFEAGETPRIAAAFSNLPNNGVAHVISASISGLLLKPN